MSIFINYLESGHSDPGIKAIGEVYIPRSEQGALSTAGQKEGSLEEHKAVTSMQKIVQLQAYCRQNRQSLISAHHSHFARSEVEKRERLPRLLSPIESTPITLEILGLTLPCGKRSGNRANICSGLHSCPQQASH
jgi:hypothetical protein